MQTLIANKIIQKKKHNNTTTTSDKPFNLEFSKQIRLHLLGMLL